MEDIIGYVLTGGAAAAGVKLLDNLIQWFLTRRAAEKDKATETHKKTEAEKLIDIENEDYDVFMAIVEQVGKDRRGVPVYERDDDGAEILFPHIKKWLSYNENGKEIVRSRNERIKHLADDLPKVAEAYKKFKEEHA